MQKTKQSTFLRLILLIAIAIISFQHTFAKGISISGSSTMKIGEERTFLVSYDDVTIGTYDTPNWTSSNPDVVKVVGSRYTSSCTVYPLKAGTSTVKATVFDTESNMYQATYTVTVSEGTLTKPSDISVKVGETVWVNITGTNVVFKAGFTATPVNSKYATASAVTSTTATGKINITGTETGVTDINVTLQTLKTSFNVSVQSPIVNLNKSATSIRVGDSETLIATLGNVGEAARAIWSSSDSRVASVSDEGTVTAKSIGKATITVSCGGLSKSCEVVVHNNGITLSPSSTTLNLADTGTITATQTGDAIGKTLTWSCDNPSVATIASDGNRCTVNPKSTGTVIITATAGEFSANCVVSIARFTLPMTETALIGGTKTITATMTGMTSGTTVSWSSNDTTVATILGDGNTCTITPKMPGTVTITATAGGESASCIVTVPTPTGEVYENPITIKVGESFPITVGDRKGNSAKATYSLVSSSDTNVATFTTSQASPTGKATVNGVGVGTATLTFKRTWTTTTYENVFTCSVTVIPDLTISPTILELVEGESGTITATITGTDSKATWSSSDESVATVDSSGKVIAVSAGTATITASCEGATATCEVTVYPEPTVTVSRSAVTLTSGASQVIEVTLLDMPEDAEVTWKSSDESVVTVKATQANYASYYGAPAQTTERQAAGMITAVTPGTATVTATCNGKSADVLVSVIDQSEVFNLNTADPDDPEVKTAQIGLGMELDAKQLLNVKWSSSDSSIADVNENGIVTGVNKGKALITANIGNLTSSFLAVVTDPWIVTEIRGIEATDGDLNHGEGEIELYDLNGLKIDAAKAASGIYIMRRGNTSTKIRLN